MKLKLNLQKEKKKQLIRLWCVCGRSSIFDSYNYFDISINVTERLDFKSLNIFFTKPRQQLKLDLFQMQSGCFVSLCKFQSNCKIITGIAAGEKNDYYSLKCILIINHHPILHNTSHLVLKVYCPSFILHQQSYNNLGSKSFFSIFSCSCVTLPTE